MNPFLEVARWLISHGVVLAFGALMLIGWWQRDLLFAEDFQPGSERSAASKHLQSPVAVAPGPGRVAPARPYSSAPPRPAGSGKGSPAFRPLDDVVAALDGGSNSIGAARRAYWNDRRDKAIAIYRAYIQLHPNDPDALGELGNVLLQAGDEAGANEAFAKAVVALRKIHRDADADALQSYLRREQFTGAPRF